MTELAGLQGNVLRAYANDHGHYAFARVTDAPAARLWLWDRIRSVTLHGHGPPAGEPTQNIAFSHAGLVALGVPPIRLAGADAFAAGMAARADVLGDGGAAAPDRWEAGLRAGQVHVLVTLTAPDPAGLERAVAALCASLRDPRSGLVVTSEQPVATLPRGREHFGFEDGFSQPAVAGVATGPRDGEGVLLPWRPGRPARRWRDVALGEFVLGRRDEGGLPSVAPAGPLGDDATYMVLRKLEQDVLGFRRYTRAMAVRLGGDPDWVAARIVGRWQNGSSLVRNPRQPGPPADRDRKRVNRFRYAKDEGGVGCPLGAHVRRANPRDGLGWHGRLTMRHRIIRRGMSYGPQLDVEAETADDTKRGLMFVCYQASIERQFEFIQRQWLNDGNALRVGQDRDPLVAARDPLADGDGGSGGMVIQGRPPVFLTGLQSFVTMRGGEYFLVPGVNGLRALADGSC